jgi:hypothetical protein
MRVPAVLLRYTAGASLAAGLAALAALALSLAWTGLPLLRMSWGLALGALPLPLLLVCFEAGRRLGGLGPAGRSLALALGAAALANLALSPLSTHVPGLGLWVCAIWWPWTPLVLWLARAALRPSPEGAPPAELAAALRDGPGLVHLFFAPFAVAMPLGWAWAVRAVVVELG